MLHTCGGGEVSLSFKWGQEMKHNMPYLHVANYYYKQVSCTAKAWQNYEIHFQSNELWISGTTLIIWPVDELLLAATIRYFQSIISLLATVVIHSTYRHIKCTHACRSMYEPCVHKRDVFVNVTPTKDIYRMVPRLPSIFLLSPVRSLLLSTFLWSPDCLRSTLPLCWWKTGNVSSGLGFGICFGLTQANLWAPSLLSYSTPNAVEAIPLTVCPHAVFLADILLWIFYTTSKIRSIFLSAPPNLTTTSSLPCPAPALKKTSVDFIPRLLNFWIS